MDKKLGHFLVGQGDGCSTCIISPREWNLKDTITSGKFESENNRRTLKLHQEVAPTLPQDEYGNIKRNKGRNDFDICMGISKLPLVTSDLFNFTICHKLIHALDFNVTFAAKLRE